VLAYCEKQGVPVLAKIPNDRKIAELYSRGKLVYREVPEVKRQLERIWNHIEEAAGGGQ